jgi:hypothetical protein
MQTTPVSLKAAERKAFQTTFSDGLWDVFIGCFALMFALGPLLSESLGDFWSSAIFLPFWSLVYLAIWLARKYVVRPRLGTARFGKPRLQKLRRFSLVMVGANALLFVLGLIAALNVGRLPGFGVISLLSLFLLAGFSTAAFLLDYPRLYAYGLLLFFAPLVGEWLYQYHGADHHGWPIVFGVSAGIMILTGLALFIRLLVHTPVIEEERD